MFSHPLDFVSSSTCSFFLPPYIMFHIHLSLLALPPPPPFFSKKTLLYMLGLGVKKIFIKKKVYFLGGSGGSGGISLKINNFQGGRSWGRRWKFRWNKVEVIKVPLRCHVRLRISLY